MLQLQGISYKTYFIYLSVLTIILLAVYYFMKDSLPYTAAYIIPSFYVITAVAHYLLLKSVTKDARKFNMYFLAAMGFKMLAYLFVLTVIAMTIGPITIDFVIAFFVVYLFYTVFEMVMILPKAKRNTR